MSNVGTFQMKILLHVRGGGFFEATHFPKQVTRVDGVLFCGQTVITVPIGE